MKIATHMDEAIEYDPGKQVFFAVVNGKRLTHRKQSGLEKLIAKAKQSKKRRGRPPKDPSKIVVNKTRGRRTRKTPTPPLARHRTHEDASLTPADQVHDVQAIDSIGDALGEIVRRNAHAFKGSAFLVSMAGYAIKMIELTGELIKVVINKAHDLNGDN